ncbi:Fructose-1-phosphate kinase or kinase (PfkB) [Halapricum desulfuricans]|uniref:Fructose-1-phosphate kinase or kinase (PfkB) n=1 Tax=Halapricum desulfuricans TaxID=2841257 RepID=A0A897NIN6_9EURY|nr:1-phosphofructokinase [Halapricum desulfuricans]QSG12612.1 Fructose-1-phosphate kinase or kinase (PfkB) [Halapricum desulfuricans]
MILTVTPNPAVDQTIDMDEPLEADSVQRSTGARFDSGGNGINVSQFVTALGDETLATGIVGGFTGYFIQQNLASFDVPTDFCEVEEPTRMNTAILAPNHQYRLNQSGPEVDSEVIDELVDVLQEYKPSIVNIGGSLPPGMEPADIDRLAGAGEWDTALDIHGNDMIALDGTYEYVKPNEVELEEATGIAIEDIDDCAEAARQLQSDGFERVIASLGAEGAMMVTPEETLYAPSLDVDVVDTVGAGDSMFAAVMWAYEQGWDDERALRAGVATSATVVGHSGTGVKHLDPTELMDDVRVWTLRS